MKGIWDLKCKELCLGLVLLLTCSVNLSKNKQKNFVKIKTLHLISKGYFEGFILFCIINSKSIIQGYWGRDIGPRLMVNKGYVRHWRGSIHSADFLQSPRANSQASSWYFVSDHRRFQNVLLCSPHPLVMSPLGKGLQSRRGASCEKALSHRCTAFPLRWRKAYTLQLMCFDALISATNPDFIMCLFLVPNE